MSIISYMLLTHIYIYIQLQFWTWSEVPSSLPRMTESCAIPKYLVEKYGVFVPKVFGRNAQG